MTSSACLAAQPLKLLAAVAALAATLLTPAHASLLTFEDLQTSAGHQPVSDGYAQLSWSNFHVLDGSSVPGSGYNAGRVSGRNVLYNSKGAPAAISSATDFALNSAYFTAAWWSSMTIVVQGFVDADSNADFVTTFVVGNGTPTLVDFGWTGLSRVSFSAAQPGLTTQFVIDNLSINDAPQAVPEPASATLVLLGLAAAAGVGARRRRG